MVVVLCGVAALVFRQFLFGPAVLLYKDIGSDSLNSYYPDLVHLSRYLRAEGFPSWSFAVGMGQDLAYATGYLIWQPVTWLPDGWIATTLVFQHVGKLILTGLLFFSFLRLLRFAAPAPLLGALLLCFSGYMCMGSCWFPLADEVLCFSAVLLGAERAIREGRWLLLALGVALMGMINPFYLYLCALFLSCYVPLRLYLKHGWQPERILDRAGAIAVVAVVGVAVGAIVTLPYLEVILHSPRGAGTASARATLASSSLFRFESPLHYLTALLRPFSTDMLGTADSFRGWQNYLEAPLTYCGLVCLLLAPQALLAPERRQRVLLASTFALLLLPTIFPWPRYLFWLFQGDYYRTYSLFWIIAFVTASMLAFSRYLREVCFNKWLLIGTAAVLIGLLYCPFASLQSLIDPSLRTAAALYLGAYTLLLAAGQRARRQPLMAYLIVLLAATELVHFDHLTVSKRRVVERQELQANGAYKDPAAEALRDLHPTNTEFFRITKLRPSAPTEWFSLNDAMIFDYYGTSSYSSFNNVDYCNFLIAVGAIAPDSEVSTRWSLGLLQNPLLSTFACEKYALVNDPAPYQETLSYELIGQYGADFLFRNRLCLPFGLTFTRYLTEASFRQVPVEERSKVLIRAVILADGAGHGLTPVTLAQLKAESETLPLAYALEGRRGAAMNLTSFRQSRIQGTLQVEEATVLVFQTPFDRGWRAGDRGKPLPVLRVDSGLLGIALEPGAHEIELRFRNRLLVPGAALSAAGLCLVAIGLARCPRLRS